MVLGVIPARGGSKGVARKNIKMIAGKPLIAWTIEAAKQARLLDRCVVSTEDSEIARISASFGIEVIRRPKRLATDTAGMIPVLRHALSLIDADILVLLQPTSPVRDAGLIDCCIRRFKKGKADNLATGFICKFKAYGTNTRRRQDLKGFFYDDGSVYVIRSGLIKQGKLFGRKTERLITSREQNIDIDDEFDFQTAEQVLLDRMNRRGSGKNL